MQLRQLTVRRRDRSVVTGIDLSVAPGEFLGLLGPNGAGKSTLMRAALGLVAAEGHSSLARLPAAQRARAVAYLPQVRDMAWPMPVQAVVALGRIPHGGSGNAAARSAVEAAIATMGLQDLRHRPADRLSGGGLARTLIARALAQDTPLLLADEPIAGLDPAAQLWVMEVFRKLARQGRTVVASCHDLGLAARYCTRLVLLHQGKIAADGPPHEVLTKANLALVYGISAHLAQGPEGLIVQPLAQLATTALHSEKRQAPAE